MKKLIALVLSLALASSLAGCAGKPDGTADIPELGEISNYTQEQLEEKLIGLSEEEMHDSWGEPDGMLSGFWGDIWNLGDGNSRFITLYYDDKGYIEAIVVGTHEKSESDEAIGQTKAENIALAACKVNYAYMEAEFDADKEEQS